LKDYYFKYEKLKKRINSLENKLKNLDEYINKNIIIDLIYKIILLLISNKYKNKSDSNLFKKSDTVNE